MAIKYNEIKIEEIEKIIESNDFKKFKNCIEKKLDIKDVIHEIKDISTYEDGYNKPNTNASTIFADNYSKVEKIVFYSEAIKKNVEDKFMKVSCYKKIFCKILNIFIKNALVHELIHVWQFENGRLNKEIIEKEKEIDYEGKSFEIEAKDMAKQIISSYGEFEKEIMDYVTSNKPFGNNDLQKIIEFYSKQFGEEL